MFLWQSLKHDVERKESDGKSLLDNSKGKTMRNSSTAIVLLLLFGAPLFAADKPNILFIAIDDQNDWIGCLDGHPQIKTPHIDRLASRGTVFTNAHCQSPLCNSSRTSLMTGLRPSTTGIYGLAPWFRDVAQYKDLVSLPQYLKKQGYTTYSTGKIYHGGYGRKKTDKEFDVLGPAAGVGVWPKKKLVDTPAKHKLVDWGVFPHRDEDKGDWKVASWAVDQLNQKPQEPFFLSVGFFLPHVPCYATQKWFDLYPEDSLELPPLKRNDRDDTPRFSWYLHWKLPEPRFKFLEEANEWKNLVRSYLACTSFVDSQVGRVLDALESNGLEENTVVVLWSDHGWHLGEKLITGKNTLWDRSTRVPLIFAGPGVAKSSRCSKPAELLDMYPTLVELCGLPKQPKLEGHSLLPQLKDSDAPRSWPTITTHNHDNHGVRSEHWRYIRYADGSEELYDMRNDPNEWNNLLGDPSKGKDPAISKIVQEHRRHLPKASAKPAPGSRSRILTHDKDRTIWEGQEIGPKDPIPEI
jgi:choline-sulfatase